MIARLYPLKCLLLFALLTLSTLSHASYLEHAKALEFSHYMQQQHGFAAAQLQAILSQARYNERVIRLIQPATTPQARSWRAYRSRLINAERIRNGLLFWQQYRPILETVSQRYTIPPEIIVAIIGIETNYGSYQGNFETVSALATLAFDYPPRAAFFLQELENLLLLAREQQRDPFSYSGSYAGAIGYPQFMPSSIRNFAVAFFHDEQPEHHREIDLENSPADAIASVANYLLQHGWENATPIALPVSLSATTNRDALLAAGIEPILEPDFLSSQGIRGQHQTLFAAPATLVELESPGVDNEYWLGYRNFYVITRYNKSSFYAMAVFQLAETLRQKMLPTDSPQ